MMKTHGNLIMNSVVLIGLIWFLGPGCTSLSPKIIKSNEHVQMEYVCRLENGDIVATTQKDVAKDPKQTKSHLFAEKRAYFPAQVFAGREDCGPLDGRLKRFENEIRAQLSKSLVGLKVGKTHSVRIESGIIPNLEYNDRYISMSRVRKWDKTIKMDIYDYIEEMSQDPEIGQEAFVDGATKGVVSKIEDDYVTIDVVIDGDHVNVEPFGTGTAKDMGDYYEILIDAEVGQLVSLPPLVARISSVTDKMFTIDYGDPFGGVALKCDVKVTQVMLPKEMAKNETK